MGCDGREVEGEEMIWLKLKQRFWDFMVSIIPGTWVVYCPKNTWRYRLALNIMVESYAVDYEVYESRLPLRITPLPREEKFPF